MSPVVFRTGSLRFYFFSMEESRLHVHVRGPNGEAKFWIEPKVELAWNDGLRRTEIARASRAIRERRASIREAWKAHLERRRGH